MAVFLERAMQSAQLPLDTVGSDASSWSEERSPTTGARESGRAHAVFRNYLAAVTAEAVRASAMPLLQEADRAGAFFHHSSLASESTTNSPVPDVVLATPGGFVLGQAKELRSADGEAKLNRWLLSTVVKARGEVRDRFYDVLLQTATPALLVRSALDEYSRSKNEEYLALSASVLADLGTKSLFALRALAESRRAECAYFVDVVASIDDSAERRRILLLLVDNPSFDVQRAVLDTIAGKLEWPERKDILVKLAGSPDGYVAEEAQALRDSP